MSTLANLNPALNAPLPGPSTATATDGGNPYAELKSTDFVKIMVEELSNQDPFEPNDSAAILEQLSSLRSIESDLTLQDQLKNLVLQNSIGQAGALIGRDVQGLTPDNDPVSGVVTSVRVVDGKTEVQLDSGARLPLERVTEIARVAAPAAAVPVTPPPAAVGVTGGDDPNDSAGPDDSADPADPALLATTASSDDSKNDA